MSKSKLPNKPSALLLLALDDLRAVEKNKLYRITMGSWHVPDTYDGVCEVCFAGAVIAGTFKESPIKEHGDCDKFGDDKDKLYAIDHFRTGYLKDALDLMGFECPEDLAENISVAEYENSPAQFKRDMIKIVKILQKHKL